MYTTFGRADIMVTSASATSAASMASMGSIASMVLVASVTSVVLATSTVTPCNYTTWHAIVMPFVMPLSLDRVTRCDTPSYESSYRATISLY